MKNSALLASLLLVQPIAMLAKPPVTIPAEVATLMKKGQKLDLVWLSPEFMGNKGFRIGDVSSVSEDVSKVVLDYFPSALQRMVRSGSPYTLRMKIVRTRLRSTNQGTSRAYVEVEGCFQDDAGKLVGAFVGHGDETIGGSEDDNARIAVNAIAFAMNKELFSSSPAVSAANPTPIVKVPAPVPDKPAAKTAAPAPAAAPVVAAPAPQSSSVAPPRSAANIGISPELRGQMKKGKKLDLVWVSQDFTGTKGCRLGSLVNKSGKPDQSTMDYFPSALRRVVKEDSPYTLNLALVNARFRSNNSGASSAYIAVEGQLLDPDGKAVGVFATHREESIGGNESDNARLAVNDVVSDMTREFFPSELQVIDKSPAVIVPAPGTSERTGIIVPASSGQGEKKTTAAAALPETVESLLSAPVMAKMQRGKYLGKVWTDPGYDRARGFSLGEIRYQTREHNDGIDKYLPDALAAVSEKEAPCLLQMHIVGLDIRVNSRGVSNAMLSVEGRIVAKDGTLLAAFTSREATIGTGDSVDDCRRAAKAIVQAIGQEFR